ncbi:hypothetical protein Dimus_005916, partial [Dionaea muscipula]
MSPALCVAAAANALPGFARRPAKTAALAAAAQLRSRRSPQLAARERCPGVDVPLHTALPSREEGCPRVAAVTALSRAIEDAAAPPRTCCGKSSGYSPCVIAMPLFAPLVRLPPSSHRHDMCAASRDRPLRVFVI